VPTYTVKQGECISSIAARFGFTEDAVYNHASNAALRKLRPKQNILKPGDQVFIPPTGGHEEACATGKAYRFIVRIPKVDLRVVLKDHNGKPFAGRKFRVTAPGVQISGKTGADGLVKVPVPATLETATLSAWLYEDDPAAEPDAEYELHIGHLDPHDTIEGIQARLQNLGYRCQVTGSMDDATRHAIEHFRHDHNLPPLEEGADPINDELSALLAGKHEGAH